jgi:GNAT superfamily N-acetyltransferase
VRPRRVFTWKPWRKFSLTVWLEAPRSASWPRFRETKPILAAFLDSELVGTVQVLTAMPPNQPHRADVAKLLVHRSARGQGVATRLMEQVEQVSRLAGKIRSVSRRVALRYDDPMEAALNSY